jgi:hypothetical protein
MFYPEHAFSDLHHVTVIQRYHSCGNRAVDHGWACAAKVSEHVVAVTEKDFRLIICYGLIFAEADTATVPFAYGYAVFVEIEKAPVIDALDTY